MTGESVHGSIGKGVERVNNGIKQALSKAVTILKEADLREVGDLTFGSSSIVIRFAAASSYSTVTLSTGGLGGIAIAGAYLSAKSDGLDVESISKSLQEGAKNGIGPRTTAVFGLMQAIQDIVGQQDISEELIRWAETLDPETIRAGMENVDEYIPEDVDLEDYERNILGAMIGAILSASSQDIGPKTAAATA